MIAQSLSLARVHRSPRPLTRDVSQWWLMRIGTSVGAAPRGQPGTIGFYAHQPHIAESCVMVSCRHVLYRSRKSLLVQFPAARDAGDPPHVQAVKPLMLAPQIVFGGAMNLADCACTSGMSPDNSTPHDGYGRPTTTIVAPKVGMRVQKYGRTTGLTTGKITAVGATQNVSYGSKVATFCDVIVIEGIDGGVFCKGGDSGSLVVDEDNSPVAMLFAFADKGRIGLCNPLPLVFECLGLAGLEMA